LFTPDERARIGARVRGLRAALQITQAQLAYAVGKSVVTIQALERARHPPTKRTVAAVAQYFHTTPDALAGLAPLEFPSRPADAYVIPIPIGGPESA
jgi:transcriptional regulator with XRE-family HTH domain